MVAAFFGGLIILSAAGVAYAYSKTTIPSIQTAVFQQKSSVYFSDGKTLIGQYGTTNREILNYSQIPPVLRNAVVAAEDKNFWHEGGISPSGIIRAAYYDLTSSGGNLQGASTITQQLVRNYYDNIGTAQTFSRKIKEIFVAQKLAQAKSKEWILQQYMNTIYLGNGAYGVAAAAQTYFGYTPSTIHKITPAQAAMIAAMIQSPGQYSPNPKAGADYQGLVYRWHYVINAMVTMGTLPASEAAQQKFPTIVKPVNNSWNGYKGYIMQAVQYELENTYHYSASKIDNGGLRIITTFNKSLMSSLYATVRKDDKVMRSCVVPVILSAAAQAPCKGLPKWVHVGAVLEQPGTGAIVAMYSGPNFNKDQYDNALQSRNQVGSSFKPYVLATAVQQGMNVQTSTLDGNSPLWIPPDSSPFTYAKLGGTQPPGPGYYEVTNDESGGNSLGPVSVKTATAVSLNTAYTDLWHRVALNTGTGAHNVVNMAAAFGVDVRASGLTGPRGMQDEAGSRARPGVAHRGGAGDHDGDARGPRTVLDAARHPADHRREPDHPGPDRAPPGADLRPGGRRRLGDGRGHPARRHRGRARDGQRADGHRQDRHHQPVPVGVLPGRHSQVRDGGRHVRQQADLPPAVAGPVQ